MTGKKTTPGNRREREGNRGEKRTLFDNGRRELLNQDILVEGLRGSRGDPSGLRGTGFEGVTRALFGARAGTCIPTLHIVANNLYPGELQEVRAVATGEVEHFHQRANGHERAVGDRFLVIFRDDEVPVDIKDGWNIHLKSTIGSVVLETFVPPEWIRQPPERSRAWVVVFRRGRRRFIWV